MKIEEHLANVLKATKAKKILEIGFGEGVTAEVIQCHNPKVHIILENDPECFKKLVKWACGRASVVPIDMDIEKYYNSDGFDLIFDGRCATNTEWLKDYKYAMFLSHFFWEYMKNE